VQKLRLVSASLDAVFHRGGLKVLLWDVGVVHPFSIFAVVTHPIKRKVQRRIPTQLGNQVQSTLAEPFETRDSCQNDHPWPGKPGGAKG